MTGRNHVLDEAIMICRRVEARWAQVHSVAPSAAAECASEIEALRDAALSTGDAWIGSIPDLPIEAILPERGPDAGVYGSEVLCEQCAVTFCPHRERLHFHHDGCPACDATDGAPPVPDTGQKETT